MAMDIVRLLMDLNNVNAVIKLDNGMSVAGTITGVDVNMNTQLRNAIVTVKNNEQFLNPLTVEGKMILCYYLPSNISLEPYRMNTLLEVETIPTAGATRPKWRFADAEKILRKGQS